MNEIDFRNWIAEQGISKKVQGDIISRLKRVERELNKCNLDKEFEKDQCESIKELFLKKGDNHSMRKRKTSFPIGSNSMNCYRHAIKRYVDFRNSL